MIETVAAEDHAIGIRVVEIQGRGAPLDMKVGDIFRSDREVGAVCHWAAHTLPLLTTALCFGAYVPWESEAGLTRVCGPDPYRSVVFDIRRLEIDG